MQIQLDYETFLHYRKIGIFLNVYNDELWNRSEDFGSGFTRNALKQF